MGMSLGKPQLALASDTSHTKFPSESTLQIAEFGRNIPILDVPLPFQSPITGISLGKPQLRLVSEPSQAKLPFESRLQMPLLGRNIPISSLPSPFQSPTTGVSLGKPQLTLVSEPSQTEFPFESRLQIPLLGRNIPISSLPSPFQSPITGSVVRVSPNSALVSEPSQTEFPFESRLQMPLLGRKIPISALPSPFQSPITGISPGKPPAHTRIGTFPDMVPVRVRIPDAAARPEYADISFTIAIPVTDNRCVTGQPPASKDVCVRTIPGIVSIRIPAPSAIVPPDTPILDETVGIPAVTVMVLAGRTGDVLLPEAFMTVRVGYHVPTEYVCTGEVSPVRFSPVPSPKLQFHAVMPTPDEVSKKVTASGAAPPVVFTVNEALGGGNGGGVMAKYVSLVSLMFWDTLEIRMV